MTRRGTIPRDPRVLLGIFWNLRLQFGWELLRQVFFQYTLLSVHDLPIKHQDKIDSVIFLEMMLWRTHALHQLVFRLSRASQVNLSPYFADFGFRASVSISGQLLSMYHCLHLRLIVPPGLAPWTPTACKPQPAPHQVEHKDVGVVMLQRVSDTLCRV